MNSPTPQEILLLLQQVKPAAVAEAVRQYANETIRLQEEYQDCRRLSQQSEAAYQATATGIRTQIDEIRRTANAQLERLSAQLDRMHKARSQDLSEVRSAYVKSRDTLRVYSEIAKTLNFLSDIEVADLSKLLDEPAAEPAEPAAEPADEPVTPWPVSPLPPDGYGDMF